MDAAVTTPGGYALDGVALRGIVSAAPRRVVDNSAFVERFGAQAVAEVVKMIGVERRRIAPPEQTTADLCFEAAKVLLQRLGWGADSIDGLIFVSQTPDYRLPATACALHARLGLPLHCQAFDVGMGCSGYVYGLWLAATLVRAGLKRVLVLAGDTSSRLVDPNDRSTAILFGDAGSATAVEADAEAATMRFRLGSDGAGARHLVVPQGAYRTGDTDERWGAEFDPAFLYMDGAEVFSFTLKAVPRLVRETLDDAGLAPTDVDAYALHQANRFMLKHLAKKIGAGEDRVPINIERFGNTSSATIPLLLTSDLSERLTTSPSRLMLVGFGVGFSWGAALVESGPLAVAETIEP
jgi:3-oxoacyl-[acyl-carrier-protein] synthase-3